MSRCDVAVVGGGHNALVAAALLARAGRSVIVLEQAERTGGSVATEEFAPGFHAPFCFPGVELFHPRLIRELALERHGLRLLPAQGGIGLPLDDGRWLALGAARSESLGAPDRQALADFSGFTSRLARALAPVLSKPLPALGAKGIVATLDRLRLGARLRRLGAREMGEALRFLPMAIQDVLDERFADDGLKAALAAPALTAAWLGPRSAGSAWGLLHHRPSWSGGLLAPPRFAAGGPGALTRALEASAKAHGAEIRTEARVREIAVHDGRATGVVLEDGSDIASGAVLSGIDPRSTLLGLAGARWLAPDIVRGLQNLRAHGSVAIVKLALDRLPRFAGAAEADLAGRVQIGASLEYLERAFDCAKHGRALERPWLGLTLPTIADPGLAPAGRHVMHVWLQTATPGTLDGSVLGGLVIDLIAGHDRDFASSVLHSDVLMPSDLERRLGLTAGCLYHADLTLDQLLYMRPLPGWYRYRTPIDDLYLCGPGTHPGGGVSGLPGRNAAAAMLAETGAQRSGDGGPAVSVSPNGGR